MDHRLQIILAAKDITGTAFTKFRGRLASITKSVFSLRSAIGVLGGTGGFGLLVTKSLDAADAIGKAADVVGLHTGVLQEYQYAAQLSGVNTELLNSSFLAFNKRLGEARANTGPLVTYLNKVDKELLANIRSAKSTEEALELVFQRMGSLTDASERAALANAAFSRSGVKLVNLTKNRAEGLKAMREEAQRLGLVIDEQLIRNSEKANDQLSTLGKVLSTQVTAAVVKLAPKITEVSDSMLKWFEANNELIQQDIASIFDGIAGSINTVADAYRAVNEFLSVDAPDDYLQAYREQLEQTLKAQQAQLDMLTRIGSEGSKAYEDLNQRLALTRDHLRVVKGELIDEELLKYFGDSKGPTKFTTGGGFGGGESRPAPVGAPDVVTKIKPFGDYSVSAQEGSRLRQAEIMQRDALDRMTQNNEQAYEAMDAHVNTYYDHLEERSEKIAVMFDAVADRMSSALADFAITGEFSFKKFSDSIIHDLVRIQARTLITTIFSKVGGLISTYGGQAGTPSAVEAAGGVYGPGGRMRFAQGGIVRQPTVFPFAGGVGLMGEAGPEAIMPLTRTRSGDLGVKASDSQPVSVGNLNIINVTAMDAADVYRTMKRSGAVERLAAESIYANGPLRQAILENI